MTDTITSRSASGARTNGRAGSGSPSFCAAISSISRIAKGSAATPPGWRSRRSRRATMPGAHNVNSAALEACPQIVVRLNARGDEYIGHGRTNAERQDRLWEEDEARLIAESTEVITRLSGRRPEGWLGPGLAESRVTLDLLKEAGYRYVMDWPMDDQPVWLRTRAGPILSVPYPIELNDLPALVLRHHSGREFAQMVIDQFDEMLAQSRKYPLVFAVALHPFVIGQPFRLRAFRDALAHILAHREQLWITTPGAIARYCESLPPGTIPGS